MCTTQVGEGIQNKELKQKQIIAFRTTLCNVLDFRLFVMKVNLLFTEMIQIRGKSFLAIDLVQVLCFLKEGMMSNCKRQL